MTAAPLVTVIIPNYNYGRFVREAIDSALSQDYPELEVIVVDDGSTDGSGPMLDEVAAADPRVRIVHKENAGLSAARNTGIEQAQGAYINFLDADDWFLPGKIRAQVAALEARPDVDLVFSDEYVFDSAKGVRMDRGNSRPPRPFPGILSYRNWFSPMAPLLRRRLVDRVGPFDVTFNSAEDWDYWLRCAQFTEFLYLPGKFTVYRLHAAQMNRDTQRMEQAHRRLLAKHFAGEPDKLRANAAFVSLRRARNAKNQGHYLETARGVIGFLTRVRSLAEARLIWSLA